MKTKIIVLLLLISFKLSLGQNLVPNGSFEEVISCSMDYLTAAEHWFPCNYPDENSNYYNSCLDNYFFSVPKNWYGYQPARTGSAYTSVYSYDIDSWRIYVENKLKNTLEAGKTYNMSFYVSLFDYSSWAVSNMGCLFTKDSIRTPGFNVIDTTPQISNPLGRYLEDSINWMKISGSFIAKGDEQFITIGTFTDQAGLDKINIRGGYDGYAGYYIDDVAVWEEGAPIYIAEAGNDTVICKGDSIMLGSHDLDEYIYAWLPAEGLTDTSIARPYVKPTITTKYYLHVKDFKYDETIDSVTVFVSDKCDTLIKHPKCLNLVPNGSFEEVKSCSMDYLTAAQHWFPANYPDQNSNYYNSCLDNYFFSVPTNWFGYQPSRTGNAYSSIYSCSGKNWRIYVENKLKYTLEAGKTYNTSFYLSLFDYSKWATSNFGAYFTKDSIRTSGFNVINANNQVQNASANVITDTSGWVRVYGSFVAKGDENFITIGTLNDSLGLDRVRLKDTSENFGYGHYYIDDVAVWEEGTPVYTAEAGNNGTICKGDSIMLGSHDLDEYIYAWLPAEGLTDTSLARPYVKPTITTKYYLHVKDFKYDETIDSITVFVSDKCDTSIIDNGELIIEKIVSSRTTCGTSKDAYAQVFISGGKAPFKYLWSDGQTTEKATGLDKGVYTVTVSDSNDSIATGSVTVTGPEYVPEPNVSTANITNNAATLKWTLVPDVATYMVRYREADGASVWKYFNANSVTDNWQVSYLNANTKYEWQIRAIVSNQAYSCFTSLSTFTTVATSSCAITANLTVNNISAGSASLNWTLDSTAERYLLRYKVKDADNSTYKYFYIEGNQNTFSISGLTTNTTYQYQIRKFCDNEYYSDFTNMEEFTTKETCQTPDNLNTTNITATSAVLRWEAQQEIISLMIRWREETTSSWQYFSKGNNGNSYLQIGCNICDGINKLKPNTTYEWQIRAFCDANQTIYSDFTPIQTFSTEAINLNLGNDRTICKGQTITLRTSTKADSYSWSNNETTSYITASPIINTTYTLTATINGIVYVEDVVVSVNDVPTVSAGNDQTICSGETISLTASGADNYKWNTGSLQQEVTFSPLLTTTYSVQGTTNNGCSNTAQVIVTVNQTPYGNAGADLFLCNGDSSVIIATGGASYSWNTTETTPFINIKPTETTSYFVTISNGLCSVTDMVVAIVSTITPSVSADQTICSGQTAMLTAAGGISYEWSTGQKTASISVAPITNTTYTVTIRDASACSTIETIQVSVSNDLSVDAGMDITVCNGQKAYLTATANAPTSFRWNTGSLKQTITVAPAQTTTYTVTVTSGTCSGTDNVIVNIINCKNEIIDNKKFSIVNSPLSIYPNPAYDKLYIKTTSLDSDIFVEIYNIYGQLLIDNEKLIIDNGVGVVNINHLDRGIYFVRIGNKTSKFIKQ